MYRSYIFNVDRRFMLIAGFSTVKYACTMPPNIFSLFPSFVRRFDLIVGIKLPDYFSERQQYLQQCVTNAIGNSIDLL